MKTPTIHLNGTSASDLIANYEFAESQLVRALTALCDARPNARDYYPQGDDAFRVASNEHEERVAKLHAVLDDVRALHASVCEQQDARARR